MKQKTFIYVFKAYISNMTSIKIMVCITFWLLLEVKAHIGNLVLYLQPVPILWVRYSKNIAIVLLQINFTDDVSAKKGM